MKKFILSLIIFSVLFWPFSGRVAAGSVPERIRGRILLQVEAHGEAWYVYPSDGRRYFLGRPADAFDVMRFLGLGARHDFLKQDTFPAHLAGMILLDVEARGEAYYINPADFKKYYLARPTDALALMRAEGLGITDRDLEAIPVGKLNGGKDASGPPARKQSIDHTVPFTSQAPYGDWTDQRQQDGCEEASALMAVRWARGQGLTSAEAFRIIIGASDYEQAQYGEYRDVSAADTAARILKGYFGFDAVRLAADITSEDIKKELLTGNIVIAPMNGQALGNPYFTPPGPERHMLVIRGYDADKDEFITNDPGTRYGEAYRYQANVLMEAIRDYPTGYHEPIEKTEKIMIVISKN